MSVIYKVVTRPSDPRVPNSPKKYYPQLITLGQSVNILRRKCRVILPCPLVISRV